MRHGQNKGIINIDIVSGVEIWIWDERVFSQISGPNHQNINKMAEFIAHCFSAIGKETSVGHFKAGDTSDDAAPFVIQDAYFKRLDTTNYGLFSDALAQVQAEFDLNEFTGEPKQFIVNRWGYTVYTHKPQIEGP